MIIDLNKLKLTEYEPFNIKTVRRVLNGEIPTKGTGIGPSDLSSFNYLINTDPDEWEAIVIDSEYEIQDGYHRFTIAIILGIKTIKATTIPVVTNKPK